MSSHERSSSSRSRSPILTTVDIILSSDPAIRNTSLAEYCARDLLYNRQALWHECQRLDQFRRTSTNLYQQVRACFFLYALHRFHLHQGCDAPGSCLGNMEDDDDDDDDTSIGRVVNDNDGDLTDEKKHDNATSSSSSSSYLALQVGEIPYHGYQQLQNRQFDQAIDTFLLQLPCRKRRIPSHALSSALAKAYYHLGFATLANQVKKSVQHHPGNTWMYQVALPQDYPQQVRLQAGQILREQTPVRMDVSHCGWSDIFFLGMDYPEGAKVLNVSIDLTVLRSRDNEPSTCYSSTKLARPIPPIDCYMKILPGEPVLKLTSFDLQCEATLTHISQVFDFGHDHLGLLKAGIIAAGIVPLGLEHCNASLAELFAKSNAGHGLHLTTVVHNIPKGSRLAVSTNLLSSIIAVGMRATGQTRSMTGTLTEEERRLVAARAILGEWLGGSGGGWQDSGGVWPGIKLIQGVHAREGHVEHGSSRGRLLPLHRQLSDVEAPAEFVDALQSHLVLVHGGMVQNVGPILEMVTEKYLLREADEWKARHDALDILEEIMVALQENDIPRLAKLTTRNFMEPLQTIIPWASNVYTETLIERTKERFGDDFLGFWMLGGAAGGGSGFLFKPNAKARALVELQEIMLKTKRELEHALPFAMDPVVYEFAINHHGTQAKWFQEDVPSIAAKEGPLETSRIEGTNGGTQVGELDKLLQELGFDLAQHQKVQQEYQEGRIGLAQNRLPITTQLENIGADIPDGKVVLTDQMISPAVRALGLREIQKGTVGVVTLAAGVGSRWTQGAGCVKAIHPFCKLAGRYRSFLEIHLAKSRRISSLATGQEVSSTTLSLPHVVTTSFMTDSAIRKYLDRVKNHGYDGPLYLSRGKAIGLRMIPTANDLKFSWEKQPQIDEQAQKVRESSQKALLQWARTAREGSDYRDNLPLQCLHPVGHFYEIPNLLLNGTLHRMIQERPQLKYLMLHNIDTVGADVDPGILGLFASCNATLSFEVIPRKIEDVGGGLARVNGKTRLIEGLALPREEDEFKFTYYNSMTTWIDIDRLLRLFGGLTRSDLENVDKVAQVVHAFSSKLPTYVALKDAKKRWGNGQEDVFPTVQYEKLWSDIGSLDEVDCQYYVVSRYRGSQLKDVSQLDGWLRDGSAKYLETLCYWE